MFRHPNVVNARRSVEIDSSGQWVWFFELTVNVPISDQQAVADIMQQAVNWAYTADVNWDKLRIVEAN